MRPNDAQRKWQRAALAMLLDNAGRFKRGPWVPAAFAIEAIERRTQCTPQAATGALRALLTVGLADRAETHEGYFWKATSAAERASQLLLEEAT